MFTAEITDINTGINQDTDIITIYRDKEKVTQIPVPAANTTAPYDDAIITALGTDKYRWSTPGN